MRLRVLAILALFAVSCNSTAFIKGKVPSESGFDGAVRVVEETAKKGFGIVTVEIPYVDVHGQPKIGEGRIYVARKDIESGKPIPVFCHVHYEKDAGGAAGWCKRGWAVATAHYKEGGGKYPIDVSVGDGYNLAHALIQWVRRLPFIDRTRLHIDGGSQGGYMALAMSADSFPVTSTTADAPVVNWAYNLNYFEMNKPAMKWPQKDIKSSPLPILHAVTQLGDWAGEVFGKDLSAETWYRLSPISYLGRIANPVMIVCATGDMLVPMEQMTRTHLRPYDKSRFPEGYQRDFDTLTICEPARKVFEEILAPETMHIEVIPLQEDSYEYLLGYFTNEIRKPKKGPKNLDRPWSPEHQWNLCYLDEGGLTPYAAHTSYEWRTSPDSFVKAHQTHVAPPEILNSSKLDYLMQRYVGTIDVLPTLADGKPGNRLNYPVLEKLDVLTGLLDYAALGSAHAERLKSLYQSGARKPLGDVLDIEKIRSEVERVSAEMKKDSQSSPAS